MKPIDKIWSVGAREPDEAFIAQAAAMIRRGGLVVFPTRGLYGLGADAFNADAVGRIFDLKGRSADKALLVLIEDVRALTRVAKAPSAMATYLMRHFWPGQVTFVVPARTDLPVGLNAGSGYIGVRWVGHPVAAALIRAVGNPLTGTSANISGTKGCAAVDDLDSNILARVDGVLDAGPLAGGHGSTVVDVTSAAPVVLREGAVAASEIMSCFQRYTVAG